MDARIARFMLMVSKFEFFLVNTDLSLAHIRQTNGLRKIEGTNWARVAGLVEERFPFARFDFAPSGFGIFHVTAPQYLVVGDDGVLKWDSDDESIDSWERLLARSFAQLRNNVAHGNKAQLPAPFTCDRTDQFLQAGEMLIDFIASNVFEDPGWETPIEFR